MRSWALTVFRRHGTVELMERVTAATLGQDLPLIVDLCLARERDLSLVELFGCLPRRFSKAGLIDHFAAEKSRALMRWLEAAL